MRCKRAPVPKGGSAEHNRRSANCKRAVAVAVACERTGARASRRCKVRVHYNCSLSDSAEPILFAIILLSPLPKPTPEVRARLGCVPVPPLPWPSAGTEAEHGEKETHTDTHRKEKIN